MATIPTQNAKGKLQELCQSFQWNIPDYATQIETKGNHTNESQFTAKVTVDGHDFISRTWHSRKKDAEQDAAAIALEALLLIQEQTQRFHQTLPPLPETDCRQFHYVDCDHCHHTWNDLVGRAQSTPLEILQEYVIRGFASTNNGLQNPGQPYGLLYVPPPPTRKDLADYYLARAVFRQADRFPDGEFHIYSKDAAVQNVAVILQREGLKAFCHSE